MIIVIYRAGWSSSKAQNLHFGAQRVEGIKSLKSKWDKCVMVKTKCLFPLKVQFMLG